MRLLSCVEKESIHAAYTNQLASLDRTPDRFLICWVGRGGEVGMGRAFACVATSGPDR